MLVIMDLGFVKVVGFHWEMGILSVKEETREGLKTVGNKTKDRDIYIDKTNMVYFP